MSTETETNPVAAADAVAPGVAGQEAPAQNDDISTDEFDRIEAPDDDPDPEAPEGQAGEEDGEDKPNADDDQEEVEHEGQKYLVPKAVRPLLMLQADYTKKTQEVAEQRRTVEEQAAALETAKVQQAESLAELRADHVRIGVIEQTIEQAQALLEQQVDRSGLKLKDVNWPAYRRAVADLPADDEDRLTYEHLRKVYDGAETDLADLNRQLGKVKEDLSTKEAERLTAQQEASKAALAKQRQETGAVLKAEVEGWNTETAVKTIEFAKDHLGISPEEMADATDPRLWKALHGLRTALAENASLKKAQKQQQTATNHEKAQATVPAVTPRGTGGESTRLRDDNNINTWMERRNAKLAKRA